MKGSRTSYYNRMTKSLKDTKLRSREKKTQRSLDDIAIIFDNLSRMQDRIMRNHEIYSERTVGNVRKKMLFPMSPKDINK